MRAAASCEAWARSRVSPSPTERFTPIGNRICLTGSSKSTKVSASSRVMKPCTKLHNWAATTSGSCCLILPELTNRAHARAM